jgi:hypothetical protein
MQVQLESTTKIVHLKINGVSVPARIWQGHTATGIPCHAFVTRIAVAADQDTTEFDRELAEQAAPTPEVLAIPLRLIL